MSEGVDRRRVGDPAEGVPVRQAPRPVRRALPRPRTAVVLAAGRSERLRPVTGGGSKALIRIGGLALLERAVRGLLRAGFDDIVVVVGYHAGPVAAVARRAGPANVRVVVAEDWEAGNGASLAAAESAVGDQPSFLLQSADHLFADGALEDVATAGEPSVLVDPAPDPDVWEEATRVEVDPDGRVRAIGKHVASPIADCGAFLLDAEVFDATRRARRRDDATLSGAVEELSRSRGVAAIPLRTSTWWRDIDTPADLSRARRLLRSSLRRDSDGPVARLVNRGISIPISWALSPLRIAPDLLSAVAFSVGLAAAALLGLGHGLLGGLLAQAASIVDGVDGEVARLALRSGSKGALLDGFLDRVADAAIIGGVAAWALRGSSAIPVVLLAIAATAGAMLSMATKDRVTALSLEPPSERRIGWLLGGRDGRLLLIAVLSIAGLPTAALGAVAATSLLSSAIRVIFARGYPPS